MTAINSLSNSTVYAGLPSDHYQIKKGDFGNEEFKVSQLGVVQIEMMRHEYDLFFDSKKQAFSWKSTGLKPTQSCVAQPINDRYTDKEDTQT